MIRKEENFDLTGVYDEYEKKKINVQALLDKTFLANGRLFHHKRVLCWFPKFLSLHVQTNEHLMEGDDILPGVWKYYIAIMAVSCYDCDYLLKILEE